MSTLQDDYDTAADAGLREPGEVVCALAAASVSAVCLAGVGSESPPFCCVQSEPSA